MADLSIPMQWSSGFGDTVSGTPSNTGNSMALEPMVETESNFCWPSPPSANFAPARPQHEPWVCEVVGLNGKRAAGF